MDEGFAVIETKSPHDLQPVRYAIFPTEAGFDLVTHLNLHCDEVTKVFTNKVLFCEQGFLNILNEDIQDEYRSDVQQVC